MPIKRLSSKNALAQFLDEVVEKKRRKIINILKYVGDESVKEARTNHKYVPRTGNLRSSIGYIILEDGAVLMSGGFEDGKEGAKQGRQFIQTLISENSSGLVLIIVAGMDYAAYVEAKNLNVLDSAEQLAERLVPQLLKSLKYDKD